MLFSPYRHKLPVFPECCFLFIQELLTLSIKPLKHACHTACLNLFLLSGLVLLSEAALGCLPPEQPLHNTGKTVLHADGWLDVSSGDIHRPARIVINNGMIESLSSDDTDEPRAHQIYLPGQLLLPGLMDCHTHLTRDITGPWREQSVREEPADWALRGARNASLTLQAGFTTVRDLGSYRFADLSLMRGIDKGWVKGPDMIACGHAICPTGGHCDYHGFTHATQLQSPELGLADGISQILRAVRYQIRMGARVIKVTVSGGATSSTSINHGSNYSSEELSALVDEAHRHGLKVAAHAHDSAAIIEAVQAGVDSIEHGFLIDQDAIDFIKTKKVWLVPTLSAAAYIGRAGLPDSLREKTAQMVTDVTQRLHQAWQAGIPMAFGTDAAVLPHGRNAEEFVRMLDLGMTPLDTIRSATLHAASLLGTPKKGQIKEGFRADIIGIPGNPLEEITLLQDVQFVMKQGEIYLTPNLPAPL